jgi:tungstate transport system substrate-binding protein
MPKRRKPISFAIAFALAQISLASAQEKIYCGLPRRLRPRISGLFRFILPMFKQKSGIDVKVIAKGAGQALDVARRDDADVVFVHAKEAEEKFVVERFGVKRYSVIYNDFVIIGPKNDPAGIKGSRHAIFALQAIKAKGAPFISRGDKFLIVAEALRSVRTGQIARPIVARIFAQSLRLCLQSLGRS